MENSAPIIIAFVLDEEQSDTVIVIYLLQDPDGYTLSLEVEFSVDSTTWIAATVEEDMPFIPPSNYQGQFHWLTNEDLPNQDVPVLLKCTVFDQFASTEDIITVHVDNYGGEIVLEPIDGEHAGDVAINYTVVDPWEEQFRLTTQFFHPLENVWYNATIEGQTSGIGPDDYSGSLVW